MQVEDQVAEQVKAESRVTQKPVVHFRDAKFNQLGDVPIFEYLEYIGRIALVLSSSFCAAIGTGSNAIGASVFFALWAVIGAMKSDI